MAFLYRTIGLYLLLCNIVFAGQQWPVTIQLHKTAYVENPDVRLGDIAEIASKDRTLRERLSKMIVMQAPRVGYIKKINARKLSRLIDQTVELKQGVFDLQGSEVVVRSRGQDYDYAELVELAQNSLRVFLSKADRELSITPRKHAQKLKLPFGKLEFKTRVHGERPLKRMSVWVDVYQSGQFYRSIPVWFDVQAFESVYVAAKHVQGKQVAEPGDFYIEKRDIASLADVPVNSRRPLAEFLVNSSLELDDILLQSEVRPVPAIISGQVLDIKATEGNVSVVVKGVARNDAEIGEVITVKSLQGGVLIKVRVVGRELAEVI